MAKSIEIFENTLLKLVVRSGSDSDRQTITLDSGELGYTTDTKRLYAGDGITKGGILVGNVFNGSGPNITSLGNTPSIGDLAFDTDNYNLYRLKFSTYTNLSSWEKIGGVYTAENSSINVSSTNTISVCAISAYNISSNALGRSLTLNSGQVTLSTTVSIDKIINNTSTFLELPSAIKINNNEYKFPSAPLSANTFLRTDASGNLSWSTVGNTLLSSASALITLGNGLTATVDGVPTSSFRLSASNIKIDGLFLPRAHATFTQAGSVLRSVGIVGIYPLSFDTLESDNNVPTLYGFAAVKSTSRYDYPNVSGYRIEFSENILTSDAVIDVQIKNATYFVDDSAGSFLSYNTTVTPFYKITDDLNKLIITPYVVPFNTGGTVQRILPARITPGYNDINTRFSVTVY